MIKGTVRETIIRLIRLSYETNTQLHKIVKSSGSDQECIDLLLDTELLSKLNQVSNLYDLLGEIVGQLEEQSGSIEDGDVID